ncbi:MAG: CBS domain-containing protein [Caulobacteraceae bacterium]
MLVSQLLKTKGDLVFTIHPDESIASAAAQLVDRRVGALVALDSRDEVAGIVSERDVVRAIAAQGAEALSQPVSTCMTVEVIFADPGETVDALLGRMTDRRIRHLPVCRDGRLVGIMSIGDLVKHKIQETEAEADGLKAYIAAG